MIVKNSFDLNNFINKCYTNYYKMWFSIIKLKKKKISNHSIHYGVYTYQIK